MPTRSGNSISSWSTAHAVGSVGTGLRPLTPLSAIILGNSKGCYFYDEIGQRPCRRIDFFGFATGVPRRHCTQIVFIDDCFLFRPDIPISNRHTSAAGYLAH
jgi:hypothetical protein